MENMRIAVIMTVFNRKEITIKCLSSISQDYYINRTRFQIDIFLTDDNSSDGTFDAIKKLFPYVNIYKTDGTLFWGRGMLHSWKKAVEHGDYDAYLWMNDDNELFDYALEEMFDCANKTDWNSIICGCFKSSSGVFTYGGLDAKRRKVIPNGAMQGIVYMNGNLVLIPNNVVEKIGLIDPHFHHLGGDYDYGFTAKKNSIKIYTTQRYIGISERNPNGDNRGRRPGSSLRKRVHDLYHCPFIENPPQVWYEKRKHEKNLIYCIAIMIKMHMLVLLPDCVYNIIRRNK